MKWPRINLGADQDIDRALEYYAQVEPSLEAAFARAVSDAFALIAKSPRRFARLETNETDREIRRAILWRFNYLVVYEVVRDSPIVLAVMHASRQPDHWRTREVTD